jgi:hypothetical protein
MELLLNILWLALGVPAVWIWLWKPAHARAEQSFGCYRPFLLLGCALIILFPVVSATDDLNAMRPEIEESGFSTRQLKDSAARTWTTGSLLPRTARIFHFCDEPCGLVGITPLGLPAPAPVREKVSRGPPVVIPS